MDSSANFRFRFFNGRKNVRIRAATTDVAAHPLADLVIAVCMPFFYARDCRTNLPGCAIAALKSVLLDECRLHGMQLIAIGESFDGCDFIAFVHHRQRETGIDASPIYQNRAGAALSVVASL